MQSIVYRGRGTSENLPNRFEPMQVSFDDDLPPEERPAPRTQFYPDLAVAFLTKNESPDIGFQYSVNPYRGCEHGCAYCYARPYHEYLGFSSGLDFETKIMVKLGGPQVLRTELSSPTWKPQVVAMSGVTDCYQPAERHFRLTRACLEIFAEFGNPVSVITKNFMVTRDLDLLAAMAAKRLASVAVSLTSLDANLAARLEPRAASPEHRLRAIRLLAEAGVPVSVMTAPIIPGLNDHEVPKLLEAAAEAGAKGAGYTLVRLPYGVKEIFLNWLETHEPGKKERVLSRLRDLRQGKLSSSTWGERMKGDGLFAEQLRRSFEVMARRCGLNQEFPELTTEHFRVPGVPQQLDLF